MEAAMTAIETTGTVDADHRLMLDEALPVSGPMRVRVIVLYPVADGMDEDEWLQAAARNPVFRDLEAPEEDVYSLDDGDPFLDPDHSSTRRSENQLRRLQSFHPIATRSDQRHTLAGVLGTCVYIPARPRPGESVSTYLRTWHLFPPAGEPEPRPLAETT